MDRHPACGVLATAVFDALELFAKFWAFSAENLPRFVHCCATSVATRHANVSKPQLRRSGVYINRS